MAVKAEIPELDIKDLPVFDTIDRFLLPSRDLVDEERAGIVHPDYTDSSGVRPLIINWFLPSLNNKKYRTTNFYQPRNIEEFVAYTEHHLSLAAETVGAFVVPHTFGLVPVELALEISLIDSDVTTFINQNRSMSKKYIFLDPSNILVCELDVIDPDNKAAIDDYALLINNNSYRQAYNDKSQLTLYDTSTAAQYVHGVSRITKTRIAHGSDPRTYLVDIEPRFDYLRS